MPESLTDARKLAAGKLTIPSELRTEEWAALPQWLRERAFYMAAVAQAETLAAFRSEVEQIAQGKTSIPQAERPAATSRSLGRQALSKTCARGGGCAWRCARMWSCSKGGAKKNAGRRGWR